jgi:tetratricopeptide (TPR) repeat protein
MYRTASIFVALASVFWSVEAFGQTTPATTRRVKNDPILRKIESGDRQLQEQALGEIRDFLRADPHMAQHNLKFSWMWPLMKAGFYTEAEDFARQAILANPQYTQNIVDLQRSRAYCFMKLNRGEEALSHAKAYYNVAKMIKTEDAIEQLAWALRAARPDDGAVIERLKAEQVQRARPSTTTRSNSETVLASITIDPKPYEPTLETFRASNEYDTLVGRGNLLLLMDRTSEARQTLEQALKIAPENMRDAAIENVARALRAEDAGIARANDWILRHVK